MERYAHVLAIAAAAALTTTILAGDAGAGQKPATQAQRAQSAAVDRTGRTIAASSDDRRLDELKAACRDKDAAVRARAALTLGRMLDSSRPRGLRHTDQRYVDSLIGLLEDRSPQVRSAAAQSLHVISGMEIDSSPGYWRAWWEDSVSLRVEG